MNNIKQVKDLLTSSVYKGQLHEVDGVCFLLDPTWDRIMISLSGGADSAILTHILSNIITQHNLNIEVHLISQIRVWDKRPWAQVVSKSVYEYFCKQFPNIKYVRHVNYIPPELEYAVIKDSITDRYGRLKSGDKIISRSYMEFIAATYDIDAGFSGPTLNPPAVVSTSGPNDRELDVLNFDSIETFIVRIPVGRDRYSVTPIRHVTKEWVIKQYKDFGLAELFDITRSCEGEFAGLDYTTYTPGQFVPVCKECFWCKEREWALKLNNYDR